MTPEQLTALDRRVKLLEDKINQLIRADRYTIQKNLDFSASNGIKIGLAATQKMAVYGETPIVQQGSINAPSAPGGTYNQAQMASLETAINAIRAALSNFGITA